MKVPMRSVIKINEIPSYRANVLKVLSLWALLVYCCTKCIIWQGKNATRKHYVVGENVHFLAKFQVSKEGRALETSKKSGGS